MPLQRLVAARAAAILVAVALLPLLAFAGAAGGAGLRATFALPMALAVLGGQLLALAAWGTLTCQLWRQPPPPIAVLVWLWASGAALLGSWLQLRTSALSGLVTIGGGDFGNHLYLTLQLAEQRPNAYQGCTSWHTAVWTLQSLLNVPLAAAASTVAHLSGAVAAAVAIALAVAAGWRAGSRPAARTAGALAGGTAAALVWVQFGAAVLHYDLAEGFVAHLHALWVVLATAFALVLANAPWQRVAAALLGAVVMRFTYGINLPGMLLGTGLLLWLAQDAPLGRLRPQVTRVAALLVAGAGLYVALLLVGSWGKPGGVAHPNLMTRTATLAVGWLAALGLVWCSATRAVGRWLLVVLGIPLAVALLHLSSRELSRAYFLWKHGHLAEVVGLIAAAAGLGAAAATALERPQRRSAWLAGGLAGIVLLVVVLQQVRERNPAMLASLHERQRPPAEWRALAPLWDAGQDAVAWQLRKAGHTVHALHPHWPLFSLLAATAETATTTAISQPKYLHPERWATFVDGLIPAAGHCVVFAAAPHRLAQWQSHQQAHGGSAARKVQRWLANPQVQCKDGPPLAAGLPPERACWICLPPR